MPKLAPTLTAAEDVKLFELPKLPYAYDALEPHIDARTMEIHHLRHHKTYIDNLNKAVAAEKALQGKTIEELLTSLASLPEKVRPVVRNNGGGHWNHTFFWQIMSGKGGKPSGAINDAIANAFKDLPSLQAAIKTAALGRFGSGWAWLVADAKGKLSVISTANQDTPVSEGLTPVLGIDVWEHAYYLKYQNKRADYVDAWFNVVNWDLISETYEKKFGKAS
ncbi:superoxide dismutase [Tuwongella immobilis]|nr:superoxide dismutase [Tuwongella immobilis]